MSEEIAKNVAFKSDGDHGPESNSLGSKHVSRIKDLWDHAWSNPGTKIPVGELVACDICGQEWTDRPERGGFLLGSYASLSRVCNRAIVAHRRAWRKASCPCLLRRGRELRGFRPEDARTGRMHPNRARVMISCLAC